MRTGDTPTAERGTWPLAVFTVGCAFCCTGSLISSGCLLPQARGHCQHIEPQCLRAGYGSLQAALLLQLGELPAADRGFAMLCAHIHAYRRASPPGTIHLLEQFKQPVTAAPQVIYSINSDQAIG